MRCGYRHKNMSTYGWSDIVSRRLIIIITLLLLMVGGLSGIMGCVGITVARSKAEDSKLLQFDNTYSGIVHAKNKIIEDDPELPQCCGESYYYSLNNERGQDIGITIEYIDGDIYKVSSLYTDPNGMTTTIANYISVSGDQLVDKG